MKFTCNRSILNQAVIDASRAVSSKSAIPTLEGLLLRTEGNNLSITGYDLEMGITTVVACNILQQGEVVISAKLFSDMLRKLPGEEISLDCDDKLLCTILCGETEYTILGMATRDFPDLPKPTGGETLTIPKATLKSMISQTLFAVANNDSKPVHTGSMFDIEEGIFHLVSVDGFRLALRSENLNTQGKHLFIVPGSTLSEVEKMLSEEEDAFVSMVVSRKHVTFQIDQCQIISRLLEGEFLDYKSAIPKSGTTHVRVSTRAFLDSLERTALLISDRIKSPLRLKFEENKIKLSCSTAIGKAQDSLACKLEGEAVEMGFNSKFMMDALRASGCDELRLEINGPLSPMRILPPEGEDFIFLVLPVRLKSEG